MGVIDNPDLTRYSPFRTRGERKRGGPMLSNEGFDEDLGHLLADPYLVLDTETTGLVDPEMVSVAVIDATGKALIDEIVRPGRPIEPGASEITGFTDACIAGRLEFPAIERALSRILEGQTVVIYNAEYDVRVLTNTYARYGLPLPSFTPWCAMNWYAQRYGAWDSRRRAYRWQSLAKAAAACGLTQTTPHTALADCLTTWQILQVLSGRVESG
jgi:DNA polymerase III subunit epsilon